MGNQTAHMLVEPWEDPMAVQMAALRAFQKAYLRVG
jgi:hypothetical protein